jgi:hypothetical protein
MLLFLLLPVELPLALLFLILDGYLTIPCIEASGLIYRAVMASIAPQNDSAARLVYAGMH